MKLVYKRKKIMKKQVFLPAKVLLPKVEDMSKWSVVACDQFTSQPEYWERVEKNVGDSKSAYHLILPEAELGTDKEAAHIESIHKAMAEYLATDVFTEYDNAYIYIERTMQNGSIRRGLLGMVDLDAYHYEPGTDAPIRATEKTVAERIPPRMRVRKDAAIELPHVLLLCDDAENLLLEPFTAGKNELCKLYDFDLMENGGHITGWLVQGEAVTAFEQRLAQFEACLSKKYTDLSGTPMTFAVGDGNHSLATAKACYEALKKEHPDMDMSKHPARYALVELENIYDESQVFEPIHRIITKTDAESLLEALQGACCGEEGFPIQWVIGDKTGTMILDKQKGELAVGILQKFLDEYLESHEGETDYIHGEEDLKALAAQPDAIGFLLPAMEKNQLFRGVISDGVLPRKTFSMGHAVEKRYYLEARKIK